MVSKFLRPWVLAALAAVAVYVAQLTPHIGIFLMMLAGALWAGALIHLSMVLLAIDVWRGKTAKVFLVLPIAFYATGFAAFALSRYDAHMLARYVAALDRSAPIIYDPNTQVVVFVDGEARDMNGLHRRLQAEYKLDLVYTDDPGGIEPYVVSHVLPRQQCEARENHAAHISASYFTTAGVRATNACMLRVPQRPDDRLPIVVSTTTSQEHWGFETAALTHTEVRSGLERAVVNTAQTRVHPPIPILIAGCALNSGQASWDCHVGFMTFARAVGGAGAQTDDARVDVLAHILGLERRNVTVTGRARPLVRAPGTVDFAPDPRQQELLRFASGIADRRLDVFYSNTLPAIIADPARLNGVDAHTLISASPQRNAQHVDMLLDGLERLPVNHRTQQVRSILVKGLITVPEATWMAERRRILALMSNPAAYRDRPGMLARLGDYGAEAVPLLLDALEQRQQGDLNVYGALIGLCRVGPAANTPDVRAAMLARWRSAGAVSESMFMAFLRMGARDQAADLDLEPDRRIRAWRAQQLMTVTPTSPRGVCATHRPYRTDPMPRDTQYAQRI